MNIRVDSTFPSLQRKRVSGQRGTVDVSSAEC